MAQHPTQTDWRHPLTMEVHAGYESLTDYIASIPQRFAEGEGTLVYKGRNELRCMEHEGQQFVVKSFHRPHFINRLVYGLLRPSKAKRSFQYAEAFLKMGVGTPQPVAYVNVRDGLQFDKSFYISLKSPCPHTYAELFDHQFEFADDVVRAVGHATAILHQHGYAHKDYGRGNILFGLVDGQVKIEIVDLNRMHIGPIGLKAGCKNFERLPATPHMHRLMAEAYARVRGFDADECFRLMEAYRHKQPGQVDGQY